MHGDPSDNLDDPREGLGNFWGAMVDPWKGLGDRREACLRGVTDGLRGVKRGGLRRVAGGLSGSRGASGGTGRVWVSAGRVWVTTGWVWGIAGKVWVMVETTSRLKLGPFSSSFQALSRNHQFFENPW